MSSLKIENQRILLVVAHPDDEVLWFYAGIEALKRNNTLEVLCLTYSKDSIRGRELISFSNSHEVQVSFANLNDSGVNKLLVGVPNSLRNILSRSKYDLAITHPPHGGEKSHPHHIQAHFHLRNECLRQNVKFAFFSETSLQCQFIIGNACQLTKKNKHYIWGKVKLSFALLNRENFVKKLIFFMKTSLYLFFDYSTYELNEFSSSLVEKQKALSLYDSQSEVLKSYNSYYRTREYLFIRSSNYITSYEFNKER